MTVDTYDYQAADGSYLYSVVVERLATGEKRVRQGVREGGSYRWNLNGVVPVLYRLPELVAHLGAGKRDPVHVVEGERDVDALRALGLTATCNPMGAGKWREWYTDDLTGARHVRIIADADEPGRAHARAVYAQLCAVVDTVELLEPPADLGPGADVSDLLEAGRGLDELVALDPLELIPASKEWAKETNRAPLPIGPLADKLENVPAEPPWTWTGYLAPGAVTLLAGRPKVGKSTFVFGLTEAVKDGSAFAGQSTGEQGVLLLSEERELTLEDKRQRFPLDGPVHLLMRHEASGYPWAEVVAEAVVHCHRHGLGVLIVDTWDKWTGLRGDDESKAGAVIEALEPLLSAAAAGLAVLVVAHQRKSLGEFGEAVRGSNALTGGVDVVVELERPRADSLGGEGVRILNAVSRFGSTPAELVLALTEDGYEARGDTLEARADAERAQVLEAIEELARATVKQLEAETGLARTTVRRHLERLLEDEAVSTIGKGVRGDPKVFVAKVSSLTGENQSEGLF